MDNATRIIEVPAAAILPILVGLLLLLALSFRMIRKAFGNGDLDLLRSASACEGEPTRTWDPRVRIVSALVFIFCTAYLHSIALACAAFCLSLISLFVSRASFRKAVTRLTAMSGFLGMLLIVLPLSVPAKTGDTIFVLSGFTAFSANLRGFETAALICLKAASIAFLVEVLIGSESFSVFLQAIESLKMPQTACRMIALAHRYMFVFGDEARRMLRGMRVRGFRGGGFGNTARAVGNLLGMLFVRSLERTERVHEAMLSRGFSGKTVGTVEFRSKTADWAKGLLLAAPAIVLLVLDRLV